VLDVNGAESALGRRWRSETASSAADGAVLEALDLALAIARVYMHADGIALWLAPQAERPARVLPTGVDAEVVEQLLALPGRQIEGAVARPVLMHGRRAAHLYVLGVEPSDALQERGTAMPLLVSLISAALADQHAARAQERHLDWALAAARLGGEIASGGWPSPVDRVLQQAVGQARADQGVVVEVAPHGAVVIAASGPQDPSLRGARVALAGTAVDRVATSGWPVLLDGDGHGPDVMAPLTGAGSAVFVPLQRSRCAVASVLAVCRPASSPSYTQHDVSLLQDFGAQAGGLLEALADAGDQAERPVLQELVAGQLNGAVIRSLFSVGLELAAVVRMTSVPEARRRLEESIRAIDSTVDDVRACIVELQRGRAGALEPQRRGDGGGHAP
jgi:hypothetical protein